VLNIYWIINAKIVIRVQSALCLLRENGKKSNRFKYISLFEDRHDLYMFLKGLNNYAKSANII